MTNVAKFPLPAIALCHFIVSDDIERSRRFYTEVRFYARTRHFAQHAPNLALSPGVNCVCVDSESRIVRKWTRLAPL